MGRRKKDDTPDTGQNAYRDGDDPFEPEDERPVIKRDRYYASDIEQEVYEGLANKAFGKVPLGSFLEACRIRVTHDGKPKTTATVLHRMPRTRMSRQEQDRRLEELRDQGRDYWND